MSTRAAVLIGIQNIAGMTPLPGAVQGAHDMAAWATAQGWDDVRVFTDESGQPVSYQAVYQHIDSLLRSRLVKQLLLYFAGHGQCWAVDADFWIISGTRNPGDVVNVADSVALARQSGVPQVSIIADACRSVGTANDAGISQIAFPLFPRDINPASRSKVDQFYATKPTQAAMEVKRRVEEDGASTEDATNGVASAVEQAHGVFTKCLLAALRGQEDAAKSRLNDDRIVIQPQGLSEFLEREVPREAGREAGFAQRPDCRPESEQVLAEVQAAAQFQIQIEARLQDNSPAEGSTLELLRYDQSDPNMLVKERRIRSWSVSERLPRGNMYGVRATLADHRQLPESPNPITYLMGDAKVVVQMVPVSVPESRTRGGLESVLEDITQPLKSFSIDSAFVLTEDGQRLQEAPGDGVFPVLEVDGLTGDEFRSNRFLRRGDRPQRSLSTDYVAERLVRETASLNFRDHYETQTGLTILGIDDVTVYDTHGSTHAFHENNLLHIRGEVGTSSSLVLDLGQDRFAALARFNGFVGRVRVTALGVENLTYMPARGAPTVYGQTGEETEEFRQRAQTALAIAEAAARHGQFDLAIDEARPIAQILRWYKHFNPVLGVFAAYAYHKAGDTDQIRDMIRYYIDLSQTVPFDVYLLSGMRRDEIPCGVAPGYPLLTQGWLQLGNDVHPAIEAARRSMASTLWTTIIGEAGRKLGEAVKIGEVQ